MSDGAPPLSVCAYAKTQDARPVLGRSPSATLVYSLAVALVLALLPTGTAHAQDGGDVSVGRVTEFAALAVTEARLRIGRPDSRWEVRTSLIYRRDDGLRQFAGFYGMLEGVYRDRWGGEWSGQAFYLDLAEGREGALWRAEYQRVWTDKPLSPLVTLRQERLQVSGASDDETLLSTWRTRVRFGIAPQIGASTRLLVLAEAFPAQRDDPFAEWRGYLGLTHRVNPSVIAFANYMLMYRDFGPIRLTHHPIVGVIYEGVVTGRAQ